MTPFSTGNLLLLLVTSSCMYESVATVVVNIGLICNQSGPMSFETTFGAIFVAVDQLHQNGYLNTVQLNFTWLNDYSADPVATLSNGIFLTYNSPVNAIFGPPTITTAGIIGYLTASTNTPWFSWQLEAPPFSDSATFPTLVKTTGDEAWIAAAVTSTFAYYQWSVAAIICNLSDLLGSICSSFDNNIEQNFALANITVAYTYQFSKLPATAELQQYLAEIKDFARIIIICGTPSDVRNIVLAANGLGMTTADYVYLAMSPDIVNGVVLKPYSYNDSLDTQALFAYNQLFFVFHNFKFKKQSKIVSCGYRHFNDKEPSILPISITYAYANATRNSTYNSLVMNYTMQQAAKYNITVPPNTQVDESAGLLTDMMYLYGVALNRTLNANLSYANANTMKINAANITFKGQTGPVVMGPTAQRTTDIYFWCMTTGTTTYQPCILARAQYIKGSNTMNPSNPFVISTIGTIWKTGNGNPPPSIPQCGFSGSSCEAGISTGTIVGITIAVAALGFVLVAVIFGAQSWIVELDKVTLKTRGGSSSFTIGGTQTSISTSLTPTGISSTDTDGRTETATRCESGTETLRSKIAGIRDHSIELAVYRNETVVLKRFRHLSPTVKTRESKNYIKMMFTLEHPNLVPLLGAHIADHNNLFFLQPFCSRGSLNDVMKYQYSEFRMDNSFKISFIVDLIKGMTYIHESQFGSHGNMKSCNCLIDVRWTLKLADFGLHNLRVILIDEQALDIIGVHKSMYWTSPELLRVPKATREKGSQPGDVYSFAIILYEIIFETEPFANENPHEVVTHVRNGVDPPHRPMLLETPPGFGGYIPLIRDCWAEDPLRRPSSSRIKSRIKELCGGKEVVLVDEMLLKMEKYMTQLEETVNLRTAALAEEKKKADLLLYRMLPQVIAESLKMGHTVSPESFECASVLFTDIVRFTCIAAHSSPQQIINFMNRLYNDFDAVIGNHDAYKVETIGDAYMIVSGVPVRNGMKHASELADVGLELLSTSLNFTISHLPEVPVMIRVGIDSGPCCSGVIGSLMPHFAIFGDTVNTASRMESHGEPLKIHITDRTYNLLSQFNVYVLMSRGDLHVNTRMAKHDLRCPSCRIFDNNTRNLIKRKANQFGWPNPVQLGTVSLKILLGALTVKGKGVMHTYWLMKKIGYQGRLPTESDYAVTYDPDGLPRRKNPMGNIAELGNKATAKTINVEPATTENDGEVKL